MKNKKFSIIITLLLIFGSIQLSFSTPSSGQNFNELIGTFYLTTQTGNDMLRIFDTGNSREIYQITLKINITAGSGVVITYKAEDLQTVAELATKETNNFVLKASKIQLLKNTCSESFTSGSYEINVGEKIEPVVKQDIPAEVGIFALLIEYFPVVFFGILIALVLLYIVIKNKN
ncbi:MAG: hypothetical protein HeimC3_37230 [Candidatus Heimdallarchaeota archaeon LC_3]|nr:MAG: hypothetical protein HeimC3_37230 [Candidatus Heimdallarchaeota archaeon LC_3]